MASKSVLVIGGGLAGLSSAVVLAEAGFRVSLVEKRPHLGGRATSYLLPDGDYVDNCQHVTMGCCTNLEDFYRRVGAGHKIHYYDRVVFLDRLGRRGVLKRSPLPAPFHLSLSFLRLPFLTWEDKRAIGRAMLHIARSGGRASTGAGSTMLDWLRAHGQTPAAIERVWRVVLVSALNEELDRAEDRYGLDVFWKAFLRNRRGFEVGIPTVPLAALYDGCREAIERRGGEVRTRASIRSLRIENGRVLAAILDDGSELAADYFISAIPHDALPPLLPAKLAQKNATFAGLANLRTSPITGVHLWLDREVTDEPFLALLDRTTQWVFNKTKLYGADPGKENTKSAGQYLQLVISASYDLVERSRQEIIDLCWRELCEALPAVREAKLLKATVVKEISATFSPAPGCDRWRPDPTAASAAVSNLFLAGDWTNTGWPSTMEGAVRSGYRAAQFLLAEVGHPQKILLGDLPSQGFARRWEGK
jgi:squalene-associated FAD-dependent desaturase